MTTRRFTHGKAGPAMSWNIYIAAAGEVISALSVS